MKLKVLEIVSVLDTGGIESFVKDICVAIDKTRFNVMLISCFGRKNTPNEAMADASGVIVHYLYDELPAFAFLPQRAAAVLRDRLSTILLLKYIRTFQPDIIHIHGIEHKFSKIINFIPQSPKIFLHIHSVPEKSIVETNRLEPIKHIIRKRSCKFIALQTLYAQEINTMFGVKNTAVLPTCIDVARFQYTALDRNEKRKSLNIDQNAFVIGNIGTFREVKNHRFLVEVFQEVKRSKPEAFLLMIGEGSLENTVKSDLEARGLGSSFLILQRRGDIPELLKAMDVYVMPSKYEGFPVSLLEAQAAGLQCVISDAIGVACRKSKRVSALSLTLAPKVWADYILHERPSNGTNGDIWSLDRDRVVRRLEELFTEE